VNKPVVSIADLGRRIPEAGRIRLGVKNGKAMKSIDTLRFTSTSETDIRKLAELYGGTPKPWNDPKANPPNQWEVITTSNAVPVFLIPDGITSWYELWAGGGCVRRCDGIDAQIPQTVGPDDVDIVTTNCICAASGTMECRPYTRLRVLLPDVSLRGVWRIETKGWNAAQEMPAMVDIIEALSADRMLPAQLSIERRTQATPGRRKRNFVVPRLELMVSARELQTGIGGPSPIAAIEAPSMPALSAAEPDIVDAELYEEPAIHARLREDAANFGLDGARFIAAMRRATNDDVDRMTKASSMMRNDALTPIGFNADGSIQWSRT